MIKFYATLMVIIASWGIILDSNISFAYKSVDIEIAPYVFDYYQLLFHRCPQSASSSTSMFRIQFVPKDDEWIGLCIPKYIGYKILISKEFWDKVSESERRQLIYNELSHCVLNKNHVADQSNYMNPVQYPLAYQDYILQVQADMDEFCSK